MVGQGHVFTTRVLTSEARIIWSSRVQGAFLAVLDTMVKILASGEIVPDDDPRARGAAGGSRQTETRHRRQVHVITCLKLSAVLPSEQ